MTWIVFFQLPSRWMYVCDLIRKTSRTRSAFEHQSSSLSEMIAGMKVSSNFMHS
ncbi:hypothetical protein [Enterococcus avium]|uniref:hypothetical protein n=1 Tax=Enterococcus avium TaxID=33945 RepID=UPI00197A7DFE|nr:hypothetical protein [Enterococcus avium]